MNLTPISAHVYLNDFAVKEYFAKDSANNDVLRVFAAIHSESECHQ